MALDRQILSLDARDGVVTGRVRIPEDAPCFEGHFPGHPILPGVAQLRLAADIAADAYGARVRIRGLRRVKFTSPVLPGAELDVRIEAAPGSPRLLWTFRGARGEVSSGELAVAVESP